MFTPKTKICFCNIFLKFKNILRYFTTQHTKSVFLSFSILSPWHSLEMLNMLFIFRESLVNYTGLAFYFCASLIRCVKTLLVGGGVTRRCSCLTNARWFALNIPFSYASPQLSGFGWQMAGTLKVAWKAAFWDSGTPW